ncbi:MAG TPA: PAS domain S-box protein, partial [Steroidobacteraceae bacterium]|nr:PAS domain S-box protein [Steroidobacteraceae bacterium]
MTRLAVELLKPEFHASSVVIEGCLQSLRELLSVDAVMALLFDDASQIVEQAIIASGPRLTVYSDSLLNKEIPCRPLLMDRLSGQRLIEIRDLLRPREEYAELAQGLSALRASSILIAGLVVKEKIVGIMLIASARPRSSWEMDAHLVLKLISANYSAGLERQRLNSEFAYLQLRNELAMKSAHDGLWDLDFERNTLYLSPRWKAMLGYADDELIDVTDWRQFVHPDDAEQVESLLREHLAEEVEYFESTHRVRHRSGEWRWVTARAKALTNDQGRLLRLVGVELDITENKLFEEALFREKESAQITLQSIGDGVITTDASGQVEYLNPVAESLTGWKLEDAMGRLIDEVFRGFHEETCEPLENPLVVAMRRCHSIKSVRPTLMIRRDGNELYIESCASPIRDGAGEVSGGV